MTTADHLREAGTEVEIYRILTDYVQELRVGDDLNCLPQPLTQLPVQSLAHVGERLAKLIGAVDVASRRWEHDTCRAIKRALYVFATGMNRLQFLKRQRLMSAPLSSESRAAS